MFWLGFWFWGFDCCGLGFMMVGTMVEWVLLVCFDGWFGFCVFIWCLMLWVGCGYLTWWFGFVVGALCV